MSLPVGASTAFGKGRVLHGLGVLLPFVGHPPEKPYQLPGFCLDRPP